MGHALKREDYYPEDIFGLPDHYRPTPEPRHADARKLMQYWRATMVRGEGFRVGRDIPARAIAPILRSLIVAEPLADESGLHIRLAGTGARRRFGGEVSGAMLSHLFAPEDFAHHRRASCLVLRSGAPMVLDSVLAREGMDELHMEAVLLPIVDRDGISPLLLAGLFYFEHNEP